MKIRKQFAVLKDMLSPELPLESKPFETAVPGRKDSTFERHFSIQDLSKIWNLSRETIRQLVKNEPGVLKVRLGRCKAMTRYSIPESVARRVHTRLFNSL
jgi:hypothetical protein